MAADLLLKALDAAVGDVVTKEYNALCAGLMQEKASGRDAGASLERFRKGMGDAIEAYNAARKVLDEITV